MTSAPDPFAPDVEPDLVPVSVRLGNVVPPEDPEDWTRPLTWIAAAGMLAAPLVAFGWFALGPPGSADAPVAASWVVAATLALGAAVTGATQMGPVRAFAGTAGSGLFAALATVALGVVMAGERPVGVASPTLAHAFVASVAGVAGTTAASTLAPAFARHRSRLWRAVAPGALGVVISALVVQILFAA